MRRLLAPVAVALLVLAACTRSEAPPTAEASADDAPVRSPTTTAPPPPALDRLAVTATAFGGPGDQRLAAVATGPTAVVAVGEDGGGPGIWSSPEGESWERVALSPAQFPAGSRVVDVTATPEGFVAAGTTGTGPAAWVSPDGLAWRRAVDIAGTGSIDAVVLSDVGTVVGLGRDAGGAVAAWASFDGFRWVRSPLGEAGAGRIGGAAPGGAGVRALVQADDGTSQLWTSADGTAWEVDDVVLPAGGAPVAGTLLGAGSTLVAGGAVDDPDGTDAAVWTSVGGPWERAPHTEATFGGDGAQRVRALVQDGNRLVAVGTETLPSGDVDAVLWTSGSRGWERAVAGEGLTGPGDQVATDVTSVGEEVVAVGWERTSAGVDAVAWSVTSREAEEGRPPEGPVPAWQRAPAQEGLGGEGVQSLAAAAAGGPGVVAVGSDGGEGAVWVSSDAESWERTAVVGGGGLLGVAAGAPGLVAVGRGATGAGAWLSGDAENWVGTSLGAGVARAVAATGSTFVAVGDDGAGAAVAWTSADGRTWARTPLGRGSAVAVVAGEAGVLAVGTDGAGSAVAWSSTDGQRWAPVVLGPGRAAGAGAVTDGPLFAAGQAGDDPAAWLVAPEGTGRADPDGFAGPATQEALAAAGGEGLFLAVGRTDLGGGDDAATWASEDGRVWARAPHDEDLFGGDLGQRMAGVVIVEGTAVAVGSSGDDAAVWFAPQAAAGGAASNL